MTNRGTKVIAVATQKSGTGKRTNFHYRLRNNGQFSG